MTMPCTVSAAVDPVTHKEIKEVTVPKNAKDLTLINGRMYYVADGKATPYTGIAAEDVGQRFYLGGSRWFGWMKVNGQWFYFDPANKGIMAKGTFTTRTGTYKVSASGAWTGTVSKKAEIPEDFRLTYENRGNGVLLFDTEGFIVDSHTDSADDMDRLRLSVSVSDMDRQVMYDMLMSVSLDKSAASAGDGVKIAARWGTNAVDICLDEKAYAKYGKDSAVTASAYYRTFIESYVFSLPQYSRLESEKLITPNYIMPKKSVNRDIDAVIHKYSGSYGISRPSTCVLHTLTEAKSFAAEQQEKASHKGTTYVSQLMDIDDDFFDDKVILYTEYKGRKGDKFIVSKAVYDSENNVYTAEINTIPGEGAETEYILLIEMTKPANASPVIPIGQVKWK